MNYNRQKSDLGTRKIIGDHVASRMEGDTYYSQWIREEDTNGSFSFVEERKSFDSMANSQNFSRDFYQYVNAIQKSTYNFPPSKRLSSFPSFSTDAMQEPMNDPFNPKLAPIILPKTEESEEIYSPMGNIPSNRMGSRSNSWTDTMPLPFARTTNFVQERRYSAPSSTTLLRYMNRAPSTINVAMDLCSFSKQDTLSPTSSSSTVSTSTSTASPIHQNINYNNGDTKEANNESKFYCKWNDCMESFSTRTGLATHCSTHLSQLVSQSELSPLDQNQTNHPRKRLRSSLPCRWDGCNENFCTLKELAKHLSSENHVGQTPFIPKEELESDAQLHEITSKNKRKKKFYCSFPGCGKCFTDSSNRKKHERTHDVNRERFYCSHPGCHKSYSTKTDLNIHFKVHKGEYPHKCTHANCGKAFVRLSELYAHERTHDNILPHSCNVCGKRFREKSRLKKHEETHEAAQILPSQMPSHTSNAYTASYANQSSMSLFTIPQQTITSPNPIALHQLAELIH